MQYALLVEANFERANLSNCAVYGASAWNVHLEGATQTNLSISPNDDLTITVDNLQVGQFLSLVVNESNIRSIIDTLTSKVVLILGRFTKEQKAVLDALREALRRRNYAPVLFDLKGPATKNNVETVTLLASIARFIIADLTDLANVPQELQAIVPHVVVPVQPIIAEGGTPFAMSADLGQYPWMLSPRRYASHPNLSATMQEQVIAPAKAKVAELRSAH